MGRGIGGAESDFEWGRGSGSGDRYYGTSTRDYKINPGAGQWNPQKATVTIGSTASKFSDEKIIEHLRSLSEEEMIDEEMEILRFMENSALFDFTQPQRSKLIDVFDVGVDSVTIAGTIVDILDAEIIIFSDNGEEKILWERAQRHLTDDGWVDLPETTYEDMRPSASAINLQMQALKNTQDAFDLDGIAAHSLEEDDIIEISSPIKRVAENIKRNSRR